MHERVHWKRVCLNLSSSVYLLVDSISVQNRERRRSDWSSRFLHDGQVFFTLQTLVQTLNGKMIAEKQDVYSIEFQVLMENERAVKFEEGLWF